MRWRRGGLRGGVRKESKGKGLERKREEEVKGMEKEKGEIEHIHLIEI